MRNYCQVGLALGGGGARGLAHLGVLSVLERERIPVDFVTGTSIGSIIASLYAFSQQSEAPRARFRLYLESREFKKSNPDFLHNGHHDEDLTFEGIFQRFTNLLKKGLFLGQVLTKPGPITQEGFARNINFLLDDCRIEEAKIPLGIIALDLKSSREVVLREGPLRRAVSASCAIPGILEPVKWNSWELVDGGWINRVPVRPVREMGADLVIAVDVAECLDDAEEFNTGLGILFRSNDICRSALSRLQLEEADVVITPTLNCHWADFGHLDDCLAAGEEAAREKVDVIRRLIRKKKLQKVFHLPTRRAPSRAAPE